jgi:hypothetical protein
MYIYQILTAKLIKIFDVYRLKIPKTQLSVLIDKALALALNSAFYIMAPTPPSEDGQIALFDGTEGNQLKYGPKIGTAPLNVVQLDAEGKLPMAILPSYSSSFVIADWVSLGLDYYTITLTHNLNSTIPQVELYEGSDSVMLDRVEVVDANHVKIYVLQNPDCRFDGSIIILR